MSTPSLEEVLAENASLKRKLEHSMIWMRRQVEEDVHRIAKKRVLGMTGDMREEFLRGNQESNLATRIQSFFGELLLMNAPKHTVEYLTDSEIAWFNLERTKNADGITVISSYNKLLDLFIEHFIIAQFRKYTIKRGATTLRTNDPLEKSLHFVITKKYILSSGRLYALLRDIRRGIKQFEYGTVFREYLEKYPTLGNFLLSDAFFLPFATIIESEVFGSKRHDGKISIEETKKTREILVGNWSDKNALFYRILESQGVGY